MEASTLDDLMAVNEQLAALASADVALDLGLGHQAADVTAMWTRFNATIGRQVSRGASLSDALRESDASIPRMYRCLMLLGLQYSKLNLALDCSRTTATGADDTRSVIRAGLLYPFLIGVLAYLGTVGFLLFLVPLLADTYDVPEMTPGPWLSRLQLVSASLLYWVAIPPAIVLSAVAWKVWRTQHAAGRWSWFAHALSATNKLQYATFAEILAELLQMGTPREEALELAVGACGNEELARQAQCLVAAWKAGETTELHEPLLAKFPPLLRFALVESRSDADRCQALRAAAIVYRQSARHRSRQLRVLLPVLSLIFIAGGITLLYGLLLFLPLVELLQALGD